MVKSPSQSSSQSSSSCSASTTWHLTVHLHPLVNSNVLQCMWSALNQQLHGCSRVCFILFWPGKYCTFRGSGPPLRHIFASTCILSQITLLVLFIMWTILNLDPSRFCPSYWKTKHKSEQHICIDLMIIWKTVQSQIRKADASSGPLLLDSSVTRASNNISLTVSH